MFFHQGCATVCFFFFNIPLSSACLNLFQEEENRTIDGIRRYPNGTDLSFPLNNNTVAMIMEYNPEVYNVSKMNSSDWDSNFEVGIRRNQIRKFICTSMLILSCFGQPPRLCASDDA